MKTGWKEVAQLGTEGAGYPHVLVDAHGCPRGAAGIREVESSAQPEPSPRFVRTMSLCVFAGQVGHEALPISAKRTAKDF